MLHTIVVYVENKPGVLSRVVSLFRRRAFNIDSLTVGRTEKPEVSRMTIVTDADEDQARRIVANVYKLVNVLLVDDVTHHPALLRDLALVKVAATRETRSQVLELATVFKARVLDIASDSITVEMTGGEEKVDRLPRAAASVRPARSGAHRNCSHAPRREISVRGNEGQSRRHRR